MLRMFSSITGYTIRAFDGPVGKVDEFYFDDETWTVRYIIVDTGPWLFGKEVLISPIAVTGIDEHARAIRVNLTRDQVKNSPDVNTDMPVSRRYEQNYYRYYAWTPYWMGSDRWGDAAFPRYLAVPGTEISEEEAGDPHLRSSAEVRNYAISARDGLLGDVDDYIFDDSTWGVRYLVINTGTWLAGRKVLLSPLWVNRISWHSTSVAVDFSRQVIRDAPLFEPSEPITRDYEKRLFRYYNSEEFIDSVHIKKESIPTS